MGVYVQTKCSAMPSQCFCYDFCFGSACGAIILQWPLTTISCSLGQAVLASARSILLDIYGQIIEKYCGCYCQRNVLTYQLGLALHLGKSEISIGPPRDIGVERVDVKHKSL
jgi:hypothetical protein